MLTEERRVGNIHDETDEPRAADADVARLTDAPIKQHQRQQVGAKRRCSRRERDDVREQRDEKRQQDERRLDRTQDLLGARRSQCRNVGQHSHPRRPLRPFLTASVSAGSSGRGGSAASRPSTSKNWLRSTPASGLQVMRANI